MKLDLSEKIDFENFEREFHDVILDDLYKEIEEQRKMEELALSQSRRGSDLTIARKKEAKADGVGNSLWGALRSRFAIASAAKQLVADANDRHQRQYSDW